MSEVVTLRPAGTVGRVRSEHVGASEDVLHRVALTVSSSLEITEILQRLADLTLEAIPADRCSLFLLDDAETLLTPVFSIGRTPDLSLWRQFKELGPIDLNAVPIRWKTFSSGRAVGIKDLATSPLVPAAIAGIFSGSGSALVVPLAAAGESLGALSLDWTARGRDFGEQEVALFEAIGGFAALAIRNARLHQKLAVKGRVLERMVEVAGALNSSPSLRSVLDLICSAFEELLGTNHCSVNLVDSIRPPRVRTLAVRGVSWFTGDPKVLETVPDKEIARVMELWRTSTEPVLYPNLEDQRQVGYFFVPPPVRSAAVFPLASSDRIHGFVVAGFPNAEGPGADDLEMGHALTEHAASAVGGAALHESLRRRLRLTEILYRLSDVIAGTAGLTAALRRLNQILRPELGIRLQSICIANAQMREAVGARVPRNDEMEAIRSWRATLAKSGSSLQARSITGGLLVPIVHRNRVQGTLRVVLDDGLPESHEEFLAAVGAGFAEVIHKANLRKDLAEVERRLAISAERDRIARDMHDSVVHLFTGIGMRLADFVPQAPDYAWRNRLEDLMKMAATGADEVREAVHALLFLQVRKKGLARSVRELARKFETSTGIAVRVQVEGKATEIPGAKEDALFRVAHEALMNVERHSRASLALITLCYRADEISLSVRDDGVGLAHRDPFGCKGTHFGLRALRQLVQETGGDLEVKNARPRGLIVKGRIPTKNERSGSSRATGQRRSS